MIEQLGIKIKHDKVEEGFKRKRDNMTLLKVSIVALNLCPPNKIIVILPTIGYFF